MYLKTKKSHVQSGMKVAKPSTQFSGSSFMPISYGSFYCHIPFFHYRIIFCVENENVFRVLSHLCCSMYSSGRTYRITIQNFLQLEILVSSEVF